MGGKGRFYQVHLRAIVFGAALLLVAGLVIGLFRGAGAVEMRFAEAPRTISGDAVFSVDVKIEKGQRVPIESIQAVVERKADTESGKQGAALLASSECTISPMPGYECPRDAPLQAGSDGSLLPRIRFAGAHTSSPTGPEAGYSEIFGAGKLSGTSTGFGFDARTGYGTSLGGPSPFNAGNGYGYGFGTATLFLRFDVTVRACGAGALENGVYYLTVLAKTGLDLLIEDLSSPYTTFQVECAGAPPIGARAIPIAPTRGEAAAYRVAFPSLNASRFASVAIPDSVVERLEILPAEESAAVEILVRRWAPEAPPAGFPLPSLGRVLGYFQVEVPVGRLAVGSASLALKIPSSDVVNPDRFVELQGGAGGWTPLARPALFLDDDSRYAATLANACCSVLAAGFDLAPPHVSLSVAEGDASGPLPIHVEASDELRLASVLLFVDGEQQESRAQGPFDFTIDTRRFPDGEHTIRVVAVDYAGWSAEASATRTFRNA